MSLLLAYPNGRRVEPSPNEFLMPCWEYLFAFSDCGSRRERCFDRQSKPEEQVLIDTTYFIITKPIQIMNKLLEIEGTTLVGCAIDAKGCITIPKGVTSIDEKAFLYGKDFTSIKLPNSMTEIGNWVFSNCSKLSSIKIPNSVTELGCLTFLNCESLTSITIPNSVTKIGTSCFFGCTNLASIKIPNRVTMIDHLTFAGCTCLTNIEIPNSVTEINSFAFLNCKSLTSIAIPESVTNLGYGIFDECTALREIHCRIEHFSDVKTFDSFKGIDKSQITVYVPAGTEDKYRHHPEFQGFKAIVVEK